MPAVLVPLYPKGERGRLPLSLQTMLRLILYAALVRILGSCYTRRFIGQGVHVGVDTGHGLDETTLGKFRSWLE